MRFITRLNVGGPARHVTWLTAGLEQAGYDSVLVTGQVLPGEDDLTPFVAQQGVSFLVIPEMSRGASAKDSLTIIWKLYRLLVRLRPGILHTHNAQAGVLGRLAGFLYRWLTPSALLGRPRPCLLVHTFHGNVFHSYFGRMKTRIVVVIEKLLARATDKIIVLSRQQFREIHQQFGVGKAEQFVVIPLGIDVDLFADWAARRHIVRDELGAHEDDILVGIVGRLTEIKNHQLFLQSIALFRKAQAQAIGRHIRFLVIGNGNLRGELEEQARRLEISELVTFMGLRTDPENFYPALDVVALTSHNEGTPLTLIEAMANARPVVATAVGGVVDLVGNVLRPAQHPERPFTVCERGVLAAPNDAGSFCRGLVWLIQDQASRQEMGERGLLFIQQNYSKDRLVRDVASLYRSMMA